MAVFDPKGLEPGLKRRGFGVRNLWRGTKWVDLRPPRIPFHWWININYIHPGRLTNQTWKSWWFGSDDFPNFQWARILRFYVDLPGCEYHFWYRRIRVGRQKQSHVGDPTSQLPWRSWSYKDAKLFHLCENGLGRFHSVGIIKLPKNFGPDRLTPCFF